jgi:hypothetical protein
MGLIYPGPPKELVGRLAKAEKLNLFIETGTYYGETASWAASIFKKVITIEASEKIYNQAKDKLASYTNLSHLFGDSAELLNPGIITEPAIFWLDAHYSAGDTYEKNNPLLTEIETINRSAHNAYILVDDARLITSRWLNEHYCELKDIIKLLEVGDRYIVLFEDVLIAVPRKAKPVIDEYTNMMSEKYWHQFLNPQGAVTKPSNKLFQRIKNKLRK